MTNHNSRDTSLQAYDGMQSKLGAQQQRIVSFLTTHERPMTRGELAALTGLAINSVCGRVKELLDAGVLIEDPARACKFSGRSAHPLKVAPRQRELIA